MRIFTRIRPQTGSRRQLLRMILPPSLYDVDLRVTPDYSPVTIARQGVRPTVSSLTAVYELMGRDEESGGLPKDIARDAGSSAYGSDLGANTS